MKLMLLMLLFAASVENSLFTEGYFGIEQMLHSMNYILNVCLFEYTILKFDL